MPYTLYLCLRSQPEALATPELALTPPPVARLPQRLDMPLCLKGGVSSEGLHATLPALTQLTSLAVSRIWNGACRASSFKT